MTDIDRLLYECAETGAEQWLAAIPADDFRPSLRFRLKMRRLLMRRRTADLPVSHRPRLRRAAIVCVMLLISMPICMLTLGAFSERFIQKNTNIWSDHTEFVYTSSGGEEELFVPLVPGYLPEGMELVETDEFGSNLYVMYQDPIGHYVMIDQTYFTKKTASTLILDTEDAYTETYMLDEYEVFYVEKGERRTLLYMDGNIRLLVKGNIAKTELENIALSLK